MKHRHHIIPRHMGGTDDPSNIVELTVEEHALAHLKLYEEYGKEEDLIAYKGLAGIVGKEELVRELMSLAGKKSTANQQRLADGTHNLLGPESNQRRIDAGTHNLMKRPDGTSVASDRVLDGTNPFLKHASKRASRPIVDKIRELNKTMKVKIGKGWHLKSDEELDFIYQEMVEIKELR
jgi:hypothetical protein